MNKMILKVALLAWVAIAVNAHAIGIAGQGTWETVLLGRDLTGKAVAGSDASAVFLYDTTLNITWLRDANYAKTLGSAFADANGLMNWTQANTWATNLVVGVHDDWRLPTMTATPNSTVSFAGGTDYGYNVRTKSGIETQFEAGQSVYSEMAHLWYATLGNKAYCAPGNGACSGDTPQPGWGLTNTGNFQNLQANLYWIGREYAPEPSSAWSFYTEFGVQNANDKSASMYALAVRSGDVLAIPVPEPETYALMLSGLAVVSAAARRRLSC